MGINRKFRDSNDRFNCYAAIFLDGTVITTQWPTDLYVRIVADHGEYLEVEDVNIYDQGDAALMCPECKKKYTARYRKDASRFISKNAIAMIRIEDKG